MTSNYDRLTHDQRMQIVTLSQEGVNNSEISRRFDVRRGTIINLLKKYAETGSVDDKRRSGRPKITNARDDRELVSVAKKQPNIVGRQVRQNWIEGGGQSISLATVKRRLLSAGLHGYVAQRKPLLTTKHRQRRLQWALQHRDWTAVEWMKVIISDDVS